MANTIPERPAVRASRAGPAAPASLAATKLAQAEYQKSLERSKRPTFALRLQVALSEVPEPVRAKVDVLRAENPGSRVQVAAWEVKGELTYFAHAIDGDHAQVLALTAQGAISAQGTALEQEGANGWKVKWR